MLNSPIIDVAIGLVFCYAALALTVSTVTEAISSGRKWRSTALFASVKTLLNDNEFKGLALKVFNHALVSPMNDGKNTAGTAPVKLPSYIPSANFAAALMDAIHSVPGDFQRLKQDIDQLQDVQLREFLQSAYAKASLQGEPLAQFALLHKSVSDWFDNSMERASGEYKRRAQAWTFGIALIVALAFNIDSVYLLNVLWSHPALTAGISSPGASPEFTSLLNQMQVLPVGWIGRHYDSAFDIAAGAAGITITAVTALFGAPFWFDALQQLVRLRGTGTKPKSAGDGTRK
jgi:hypothetical protein